MESRPQVESIARVESTVPTAEFESDTADKKPIHIIIRLIGEKETSKSLIIDTYLGKNEDEQISTTEHVGTDTAVDQGESIYNH